MKLLRLQFSGIGSFADSMEIDFRELSAAGLFLIEGPTGSGKSTILDAIVYALYGSVAGSESDLGRLDSHLRDDSPFVELDFAVNGAVYRVRRSPAHERRKQRGEGMTSQNATASLMRLMPDQTDLGNRASEVSENITSIVGLTKKQFVATVVLAQGEFSAFLDADTADRSQILEKVFGTEFFSDVEDQLQTMRSEAKRQRAQASEQFEAVVHACSGILGAEIDMDDALAVLDQAIAELSASRAEAESAAKAAEMELQQRQDQLGAMKESLARQTRKRDALQRKEELELQRTGIDVWRVSLAAHRRALPVKPAAEECDQAAAALEKVRNDLAMAEAALKECGHSTQPTGQDRDRLVAEISTLQRLQEVEAGIPALRSDLRLAQETAGSASELVKQETERLEGLDTEINDLQAKMLEEQATSQRVALLSAELTELKRQDDLWAQLVQKRQELQEAQRAVEIADSDAQAAQKALGEAEIAQRLDEAAALAAHLVDGQPCLVCGSPEHPDPAVPDGEAGSQIASLTAAVQAKMTTSQSRKDKAAALSGMVDTLAEQVRDDREQVKTRLGEVIGESEQAEIAAKQMAQARARLDSRREELSKLIESLNLAKLEEQKAGSEVAAATERLDRALAEVSNGLEGFDSVAQRLQNLEKHAELVTRRLELGAGLDAAEVAAERAGRTLQHQLDISGFENADAARACVLDPEETARRTDAVEVWDQQTSQTEAILGELADVSLEHPYDIEGQTGLVAEAKQRAALARSEAGKFEDRLKRAIPQRDEVDRRHRALVEITSSTDAVIRMADLATAARGEVIHKVRLSSFVLMRRFQDVVLAANHRLNTISEGRYQLDVETRGLDKRGQAGLDLRIHDAKSDRLRSTKSLSGGERFYVALALALGLADVVRSESGGVQLGTLFIDEGFGSLDPDVLEEVMDMLEQVRVGDDRVIGLISHVETLKQRIDPRISVRPDPKRPGVSGLTVKV